MKYHYKEHREEKANQKWKKRYRELDIRAKSYKKADSWKEYMILMSVAGYKTHRLFDRFWWLYVSINLGDGFRTLLKFSIIAIGIIVNIFAFYGLWCIPSPDHIACVGIVLIVGGTIIISKASYDAILYEIRDTEHRVRDVDI